MARDMEQMLRRLIGEDIALAIDAGEEVWPVLVDPGKIEQVVMNLAANARDAMPLGGHLSIAIGNVMIGQKLASPHSEVPPGDYVRMAVSDTGIGMDETIRAHLFEPFFTTKPRGKGTGLGLATVYGICRQSDGYVFCHSAPGRGATFEILLPRAHEEDARSHGEAQTASSSPGGSERVLLVEDDDSVRGLIVSILARAGYGVTEVRSGEAALRASDGGGFDLLVTDVVMPGMDGPEAATRIAKRCPGIGVLFVSGYAEGRIEERRRPWQGAHFLQKPFTPETLLHKVREVLELRRAQGSPS
ncbi:MAG TPA: ATP-binding protein, partial [Spirochaetia bacterium]